MSGEMIEGVAEHAPSMDIEEKIGTHVSAEHGNHIKNDIFEYLQGRLLAYSRT